MKKVLDIFENKKISFTIIVILLFIFLIIMFCSILKNNDNEEESIQQIENINITDEIKENLSTKIIKLKYKTYCEISTEENEYENDCLYRKNLIKKEDLTEQYRLYVLILSIDSLLETKTNYIVGNLTVDNIKFTNTQYIDYDTLAKQYISIYGDETEINPLSVNEINNFPYVKYDETRKKFFYQTSGLDSSTTSKGEVIEYINRYESDTENIYVYVNVAFVSQIDSNNYNVYKDKSQQENVKTITIEEYDNIIDETNYNQFTEYKYTFSKEEIIEDYIFKQVELVE